MITLNLVIFVAFIVVLILVIADKITQKAVNIIVLVGLLLMLAYGLGWLNL